MSRALAPLLTLLCVHAVHAAGAPERLVITHRLADERAAAQQAPVTPTAAMVADTRYVMDAPVVEAVRLAGLPQVGADGMLKLSVACPAVLAGRPALFTVFVPTRTTTHVTSVQCPAGKAPVALGVPGFKPGERPLPVVKALGVPGRIESGWLEPGAGARLSVGLGVVGMRPGEKTRAPRFRITAEAKAAGKPVGLVDHVLAADAQGWTDLVVDLEPARRAAGGPYRLVFEVEFGEAPAGFPVWGDPIVFEPASTGERPWNVVLVSIDTLRADRLGCYGATRATSPTLDRFGAEGAVFTNAVAPAPWTLPSHASLMTGLYSCAHGLVTAELGHQLGPGIRPLAMRMRDRGYATAAFTEDAYVEPSAFQPGFSFFRADTDAESPGRAGKTVGAAIGWLRANAGAPFLLFVHTYQTHAPIRVPPAYYQMFTTTETPDGPRPVAESGENQQLVTYDTAIRYTDDSVATLLATLAELQVAQRTIVVVTSDHGEAFGEHDFIGHGKTLYQEELHIPLLIRAPGKIEPGRRIADVVSLVDVAPTLLDLLGFEALTPVQGRTLVPLLGGPTAPAPASPSAVYVENSLHDFQMAVRTPAWKAIFEKNGARVYQLPTDPAERRPVDAGAEVDEAKRLRAEFEARCGEIKATLAAKAAAAPPLPRPVPDPAHAERLRALGYVQ